MLVLVGEGTVVYTLRFCYITVDSAITALQNSACTYSIGAFPTKFTINHPFQTCKVWSFMKTTSLTSVWKNKLFYNIFLTQNHACHIPKVIEITINIGNNLGTTLFCHVLCLGMHSSVMHRFLVQAFQDPPFCSSTHFTPTPCLVF